MRQGVSVGATKRHNRHMPVLPRDFDSGNVTKGHERREKVTNGQGG